MVIPPEKHDAEQEDLGDTNVIADELLGLVRQLVSELHPHIDIASISLQSTIDGDLGIDSLGRVELISRVEKQWQLTLPEQTFATVETVDELLQILLTKEPGISRSVPLTQVELLVEETSGLPEQAATLWEVLQWHVKQHPERPHIQFYQEIGEGEQVSYLQLRQRAEVIASGLVKLGLAKGDTVAIMLPTSPEYFYCFMGVIAAGCIPVPLYPPARLSQIENYLRRNQLILNNCQARLLISVAEIKKAIFLVKPFVASLRFCVTCEELSEGIREDQQTSPIASEDTAFIQYTSGSTGDPKGVVLSHANLLANIRVSGQVAELSATDVFVSWLPLYHDMGLIGAWMGSLYHGCLLVLLSPIDFLTRPARWLWALHRYRGTVTAAPNFAYDLCISKISDDELEGLDLSNLRISCNGAEPVIPQTLTRFINRFSSYGFKSTAMWPVYGLAEVSVGLTFPPLNQRPIFHYIQRSSFIKTGIVKPVDEKDPTALCFISCGRVLPGHNIRIVDKNGQLLAEGRQGRLQFQGPSATAGYLHNEEATATLFQDGWLETGDLAYLFDGNLYITGRSKDIIIRAGRNIYPQQLEEEIGNLNGIRKGRVAVFGSTSGSEATEQLIVLAETRETEAKIKNKLVHAINQLILIDLGQPADKIILAPPNTILKTSSGKLRHAAMRRLFEKGDYLKKRRPVWWQLTRLGFSSLYQHGLIFAEHVKNSLYGVYTWLFFIILTIPVIMDILLIPKAKWRFQILKVLLKLFFKACAVRVKLGNEENLKAVKDAVFVSNHTSYLDALVLISLLPGNSHFVAKEEFFKHPILRFVFKRLGCIFVERFDAAQAVADAGQLTTVSDNLVIFPEGTFQPQPGLMPFHMGAFLTAIDRQSAIVPIVIEGARQILADGIWRPIRNDISVLVGSEILSGETNDSDRWEQAIILREKSRSWILAHCKEPDLS